MASKAIDWINALATIWKVLVGIVIGVAIASASVATAYAMLKADTKTLRADTRAEAAASQMRDEALEGRVDKLEVSDDAQYEEQVIAAEKERLAREKLHAVEAAATSEYRKDMRDRMGDQESATSKMQGILEQIDKRIP